MTPHHTEPPLSNFELIEYANNLNPLHGELARVARECLRLRKQLSDLQNQVNRYGY